MRFNHYLLEEASPEDLQMVEEIKQNCQKYIKFVKSLRPPRILDRESNSVTKANKIVKYVPRKDRKPMDTHLLIHKVIDNILYEKFGWKPRSEGVFCDGRPIDRHNHLFSNLLFPAGDFSYLWSPEIEDLYMDLGEVFSKGGFGLLTKESYRNVAKILVAGEDEKGNYKKAMRIIRKNLDTYTDKGLERAMKSGNEIMIRCNEYYMIPDKLGLHSIINDLLGL